MEHPMTLTVDDIRALGEEERIYRLRCVEAWSMVIPWLGGTAESTAGHGAAHVRGQVRAVRDALCAGADAQPGRDQRQGFPWPYVEGLRLDEARHDLTLLGTGLYGKPLEAQNGAPIRLVVPWKYGFKSIKSIVKIDLVSEMPVSFWMQLAPNEYGFYANVNPDVSHPRWSQATERRIGDIGRRETLLFNGYGDQVASLYEGMDLRVNF